MIWIVVTFLILSIALNILFFMYARWASGMLKRTVNGVIQIQDQIAKFQGKLRQLGDHEMFKFHAHRGVLKEMLHASNEVLFSVTLMNELLDELEDAGVIDGISSKKINRRELIDVDAEFAEPLISSEEYFGELQKG